MTRDELAQRMLSSLIGSLEIYHVYLGDKLGLYRALAAEGPLDAAQLAQTAGIHPRYAREWLEEQAVAGYIAVAAEGDDDHRRYALPEAHRDVLVDSDNLKYSAPFGRLAVSVGGVLPRLVEAFKTGAGIPSEAYGPDGRSGTADGNRVLFINLLGTEWLPAIPDVHQRLRSQPPARVADFGCGTGNSSIAIAQAYPLVTVLGIDLDATSVEQARDKATKAGLDDRVRFEARDAGDPALAGSFDLVTAFETIHDMTHPVAALRAMRQLCAEGGAVLVVDERVSDELVAPGDEMARLHHGFSAVSCLAAAMGDPTSAMTGTVMRPATLRRYAHEAGYDRVEILPIENEAWRFYRLFT